MENKYFGVIYIYESPSHKFYIGQTMRPHKRKIEHKCLRGKNKNSPFHRAIAKYGFDAFKYKELFLIQRDTKEKVKKLLDKLEQYLIQEYRRLKIPLYNISDGGDTIYDHTGEHLSQERKEQMRQWALNYHKSLSEQEKKNLGKLISEGKKKPILQFDLQGNFIREWHDVNEVTFAKNSALRMCLTGKNKTCAGYKWKYKNEYNLFSNS